MPRFDFQCENPECARIDRDVHVPTSDVGVDRTCMACLYPMQKLAAAPNFVMRGYTAKSGYSRKD